MMKPFLTAAVFSASVALGVPAAAQQALVVSGDAPEAAIGGEQQWGTASDIVFTAWAADSDLFAGTEGPYNLNTAGRICSAGVCGWGAGVHLPSGAQILGFELSACDDDVMQELAFYLIRGPKVPGPVIRLIPPVGTGAIPGCATFTATLPVPHTVQNNVDGYAYVVHSTPGNNVEWTQFRVRYRLQVSPAPATATFGDVPTTHPFFRFVEALAASGVTGGCGGGNYCPDSALTRGQMAVFLAAALGLHFPN
jgi:hypothetical protein